MEEKSLIRQLVNGKYGKRYLEIGAFRYDYSQCSELYHQDGYTGIVFEPQFSFNRQYAEMFKTDRPKDEILPRAVSDYSGFAHLYVGGMTDTACSTILEEEANRLPYQWEKQTVDVFDAKMFHGNFDFMCIDVEGMEERIIKRLDFNILKVGVFCIESLQHGTGRQMWHGWEPTLIEAGYEYIDSIEGGLNRIYKHKEY